MTFPRRFLLPGLLTVGLLVFLVGCGDASESTESATEVVVDRYPDSTRQTVEVRRADTLVERRHYRPTGALLRIERGDSVQTYFDIHDADSSFVLADYMLGTWDNVSADTTSPDASATYVFTPDSLVFRNPSGETIETIGIGYEDFQTLRTSEGMPVTADIVDFDTVRVTGYTLVRDGQDGR